MLFKLKVAKNQIYLANVSYENQRNIKKNQAMKEYSKSLDHKPQINTEELMKKVG